MRLHLLGAYLGPQSMANGEVLCAVCGGEAFTESPVNFLPQRGGGFRLYQHPNLYQENVLCFFFASSACGEQQWVRITYDFFFIFIFFIFFSFFYKVVRCNYHTYIVHTQKFQYVVKLNHDAKFTDFIPSTQQFAELSRNLDK